MWRWKARCGKSAYVSICYNLPLKQLHYEPDPPPSVRVKFASESFVPALSAWPTSLPSTRRASFPGRKPGRLWDTLGADASTAMTNEGPLKPWDPDNQFISLPGNAAREMGRKALKIYREQEEKSAKWRARASFAWGIIVTIAVFLVAAIIWEYVDQ